MEILNQSNFFQNLLHSQNTIKRKSNVRYTNTSYKFSFQDKILKDLTSLLQKYSIRNEAETLARSILNMDGIVNMNVQYLAAALYLYHSYESQLNKKKGNKILNITSSMFEDTLYMKTIRDQLKEPNKITDSEKKEEFWIRQKQNILIYLENILTYYSEEHELYKPSLVYKTNKEISKYENELDLIEEAEGGSYIDSNSPTPIFDPDE
jgi:hypothetical protein